MNRLFPILTLIVGVAVGVLAGLKAGADPERDLHGVKNAAGEDLVARSEFEAELNREKADRELAQKSAKEAFEREKWMKEDAERLSAEIRDLKDKLALQDVELAKIANERAERLTRIAERFKTMKGKGLQNLVTTNELGKFIADLRLEGDVGRKAVLDLLRSDDEEERRLAATLLMQGMADDEAIEPLREVALHDEDELSKRLASQALLRLEGDGVVPTLEELVANADDEGVRVNSMYGLLMRGKGVDEAIAYMKDESKSGMMKQALGSAVFILQDRPEVQPLVDLMVKDSRGKGHEVGTVQAAIAYYKKIATPGAVAALQQLAADPNLGAELKGEAAKALAALGK
ncbi:MAG: HEAT repeat domain-containing protein [Planctomycetes bacterium]|nr:HEAT repeat domain-containing protein [Planctomycetota bacterium]